MLNRFALAASCLLIATSALSAQVAINDMFNRANGGLGPDWMQVNGTGGISGNQLVGTTPWSLAWSTHTAYGAGYQSTVIRASFQLSSPAAAVSLIAGVDPATWQGIEVRIADNTGNGIADRIFFNAAVNAGNWYGGSTFANIVNPLSAGEATLWFTNGGDTANIEIRNPATGTSEVHSRSGILGGPPTGTTVGVGYRGTAIIDDYRAWTGSPNGPVITATAPRVNTPLDLLVTDGAPSSLVYVAYSLAGNGPTPSPVGTLALGTPYEILGMMPFNSDSSGRVHILIAPFPAGLIGTQISVQALDLGTPALTNGFTATLF